MLLEREHFGTPVALRRAKSEIERAIHERVAQFRVVAVDEHDHAETLSRQHADERAHAVDAAGVHPDDVAGEVMDEPSQGIRQDVRLHELERLIDGEGCADLGRDDLAERRRLDQPPAIDTRAVEHEAQPLRHVGHTRPDRADRRHGIDAALPHRMQAVVRRIMRGSHVRPTQNIGIERLRFVHAERCE